MSKVKSTIKVLLLEDNILVIDSIKNLYELNKDILVLPSGNDPLASDLSDFTNFPRLETIYKSSDYLSQIDAVLDSIIDIDLFIVDIALNGDDDILGIEFINHFASKKQTYNHGKSKIIILSQYGKQSNQIKQLSNAAANLIEAHIKKDRNNEFYMAIENYIQENFSISPHSIGKSNLSLWKEIYRNPINQGAKYLDKLILIIIGFLFFGGLLFASIGISMEFIKYFFDSDNSKDETKILEVVEHIFIYLIPLFLFFGLYNYYSSTTAVKLRGGTDGDIDHHEAIKGINTSKVILLSSILSFTLVSAIEKLAKGENIFENVLGYSVIIILLMIFILLLHKVEQHSKKE